MKIFYVSFESEIRSSIQGLYLSFLTFLGNFPDNIGTCRQTSASSIEIGQLWYLSGNWRTEVLSLWLVLDLYLKKKFKGLFGFVIGSPLDCGANESFVECEACSEPSC